MSPAQQSGTETLPKAPAAGIRAELFYASGPEGYTDYAFLPEH